MTEREAMIRAALSDPDNEAPRLILADWLEEHEEDPPAIDYLRNSEGRWDITPFSVNWPTELEPDTWYLWWMSPDNIHGCCLWEPPYTIYCQHAPRFPVVHITGEESSYQGQPCGQRAEYRHSGKWVCAAWRDALEQT